MVSKDRPSATNNALKTERRNFLRVIGATGLSFGLAGCMGNGNGNMGNGNGNSTGTTNGSGDGTQTAEPPNETNGSLTFSIPSQLSSMDVHKTNRVPEQITLNAIHETLFRLNTDKQPIKQLVSDYEVNQDGKQFIFQIRDGVTFHDGSKLNGDVVAFNLQRFDEQGKRANELGGPTNIKASGDMEVTVEYDSPYPRLPIYLTGFYTGMASKKAIQDASDSYGTETVVGTGPFKFKSWQKNQKVELTRFDDYSWGPEWAQVQGPARVKDITIRRIPEATTRIQELINADTDATALPPVTDAEKIKDSDKTVWAEAAFPYPAYFTLNMAKEPTNDSVVRKALNYAIKRDPILQASQEGHGQVIWGLGPPVSVNGLPEDLAKKNGYNYNPKKARQLLDQAGWTNSKQGEIRKKNGKELSLTHLAFDLPEWSSQAEVGQQMFRSVGVNVNLKTAEGGTFYKTMENQEYHMVTAGTEAPFASDFFFQAFHSDNLATEGGFNSSMLDSKKMDNFIDTARKDTDQQKRQKAIRDAELMEREVASSIPIQVVSRSYARKKTTKGVEAFLNHPWWPNQYYIHWTDVYAEE